MHGCNEERRGRGTGNEERGYRHREKGWDGVGGRQRGGERGRDTRER